MRAALPALSFVLAVAAGAAPAVAPMPVPVQGGAPATGHTAAKPPAIDGDAVNGISGLPVPRFVSLKKGEAYLRTGPGDRYPIAWVYVRKGLPMEVIAEYGIWRQVRDIDHVTGWMNKSLISGERTAVITGQVRTMYASADLQAPAVWRIAPGAVVRVVLCDQAWCRVDRDGKSGYILRAQLWGVTRDEPIG